MSVKSILFTIIGLIVLLLVIILPFTVFYNVDAGEIAIHQDYMSGKLTVWSRPGLKWQGLGSVTSYPKSDEFKFKPISDDNGKVIAVGKCIPTRFADKGKAEGICGQVSFDLPTDPKYMLVLHEKYGSVDAIRDRIVDASMGKAIFHSGQLMSSKDSAGKRRGELITRIQEQAMEGIYKTEEKVIEEEDFASPPIETITLRDEPKLDENGDVVLDDDGNPVMIKKPHKITKLSTKKIEVLVPVVENGKLIVREASVAKSLGVRLHSFKIDNILYETKVQDQIDRQRDMEMKIQTKIAEAESAKQDAITAEAEGRAKAAEAKWTQEVEKAKVITTAEQERERAQLDLETAELEKRAKISRAEGEARAKKLVMDADGALDKKLAAWKEVQMAYAAQWGKQPHVPSVVMGSSGSNDGTTLQDMLMLSAAKDIGLNYKP